MSLGSSPAVSNQTVGSGYVPSPFLTGLGEVSCEGRCACGLSVAFPTVGEPTKRGSPSTLGVHWNLFRLHMRPTCALSYVNRGRWAGVWHSACLSLGPLSQECCLRQAMNRAYLTAFRPVTDASRQPVVPSSMTWRRSCPGAFVRRRAQPPAIAASTCRDHVRSQVPP